MQSRLRVQANDYRGFVGAECLQDVKSGLENDLKVS